MLDKVITRMTSMHADPEDFGTGVPLHRAEIHTVQAIGHKSGMNVTQLAERMGTTKGAASQMVSKLVRKGLVRKSYAPDNAKEVLLELTDLGRVGFETHEHFHAKMFELVREHFAEEFEQKMAMFLTVLADLDTILDRHEQEKF